jgi:NAD(P)-dependent dehydrogenase (short-subunit alcohol dehydrogenase family)
LEIFYNAAEFAVEGLSEVLSKEVEPRGITATRSDARKRANRD